MSPGCFKNDYSSSYSELPQNSESVSMETQRVRAIAYEVYKTLRDLNPNFMKEIPSNLSIADTFTVPQKVPVKKKVSAT